MVYVYASILVVVNTVALVSILFGLPGTWIMALGTALLAWLVDDEPMFSLVTVVAMFALAILGEVTDWVAAAVGAKTAGAGRSGAWGGILGGIVGAIAGTALIPVPVIGTIVGGCLGAFVLTAAVEWAGGRPLQPALRTGGGAAAGRLAGTLIKLALGVVMWVWIAVAAFWP